DRLPDSKALGSMELRFREAPVVSPFIAAHLTSSFVTLCSLGTLFVAAVAEVPAICFWLWGRAQALEGMTVVGGMLGAFILILLLLCVFLLPPSLRIAFAGLTLPAIFSTTLSSLYVEHTGAVTVGIGLVFVAPFWKGVLVSFHKSWVSA